MTAVPLSLFDTTPPPDPEPARRVGRDRLPASAREPEALLTAIEAAAVLNIGRSKLYELVARGTVTSVKLDRCRRFRRSDLDRFIRDLPTTVPS